MMLGWIHNATHAITPDDQSRPLARNNHCIPMPAYSARAYSPWNANPMERSIAVSRSREMVEWTGEGVEPFNEFARASIAGRGPGVQCNA